MPLRLQVTARFVFLQYILVCLSRGLGFYAGQSCVLAKLLYGLAHGGLGFFDCAFQPSARSVEVAAAVEVKFGHAVAGEVVNRAEAHPYEVVFLCVLPQRYAQFRALYLQGHVHQSLGVALYVMEFLEVVAREQ